MASSLTIIVGPLGVSQNGKEYPAWEAESLIALTPLPTSGIAGFVQNQAGSADYTTPTDGRTYIARLKNTGGAIHVHHSPSTDASSSVGFDMADGDEIDVVLTGGSKISAIDQ